MAVNIKKRSFQQINEHQTTFRPASQPASKKKRFDASSNDNDHNHNKVINADDDQKSPTHTLKQLTPWVGTEWTTEVRVIYKKPLKVVKNKSILIVIVADVDATLMQMTFWEADAMKYNSTLQKRQLYRIENAKIQKKMQYAYFNDYELICTKDTKFIKIETVTKGFILNQIWNFVESISEINTQERHSLIDVAGFITNVSEPEEISTRRGSNICKITFELVDQSAKIACTLWGEEAKAKFQQHQLIAIKSAQVNYYMNRTLDIRGYIEMKPKHDHIDDLKKWKEESNKFTEVIQKIQTITDPTVIESKYDWDKIETKHIATIIKQAQRFKETQVFPQKQHYKVQAAIKNIDGKMWFEKNNRKNWCLKLTLTQTGKWMKAIAFEKPSTALFYNLTADEAAKMQQQKPEQFIAKMEKLMDEEKEYIFCMYIKENNYFETSRLDHIIEKIENVEKVEKN